MAKLQGEDKIRRNLQNLQRRMFSHEVGPALFQEAQIERKESMRNTPVLTGAARASHEVSLPDIKLGGSVTVEIKVGGPALGYVVPLHEDLDAFHKTGKAKFLEDTILASAPHMANRVGRRIKMNRVILG